MKAKAYNISDRRWFHVFPSVATATNTAIGTSGKHKLLISVTLWRTTVVLFIGEMK